MTMTFPGAYASVYRNEAGEVLGWDYPSEPDYDPDDYLPDDDYDGDQEAWVCDDDGEEFDTEGAYDRHRSEVHDNPADDLGEHHEREHPDGDPVTVR